MICRIVLNPPPVSTANDAGAIMMCNLVISGHKANDRVRALELNASLSDNLLVGAFSQIIILAEPGYFPPPSTKINVVHVSSRPTFQDFIDAANKFGDPFTISILANSDIVFDSSIVWLERLLHANACVVLSRWEQSREGSFHLGLRYDSQDAWCFKGKIDLTGVNYPLGWPGSDNHFLSDLKAQGYRYLNPSHTIVTYHYHQSKQRDYLIEQRKYIDKPWAYSIAKPIWFWSNGWFSKPNEIAVGQWLRFDLYAYVYTLHKYNSDILTRKISGSLFLAFIAKSVLWPLLVLCRINRVKRFLRGPGAVLPTNYSKRVFDEIL